MKIKATMTPKPAQMKKILKAAEQSINNDLLGAIGEATLLLHETAVRGIMEQSAGEAQTRYNPKRMVIASKPGDPPNVDHGIFVRSVKFEIDAPNKTGYVGSNDVRATWFEFGTKHMKKRPWLGSALKKCKTQMKSIFKKMKVKI